MINKPKSADKSLILSPEAAVASAISDLDKAYGRLVDEISVPGTVLLRTLDPNSVDGERMSILSLWHLFVTRKYLDLKKGLKSCNEKGCDLGAFLMCARKVIELINSTREETGKFIDKFDTGFKNGEN